MLLTVALGATAWCLCLWHFGYFTRKPSLPPAQFSAHVYRDGAGHALQYRLLAPLQPEPGRRYPLVLILHGGGCEGTDNQSQLLSVAPLFTTDDVRTRFPGYVLAPQCPPRTFWVPDEMVTPVNYHFQPRPTEPLRLALELTDALARTLPIDADRVYLVGYSRGATGGWDALVRNPRRFAAAVLVCGNGLPTKAPSIAHVPLWIAHGARDATISVTAARGMVQALRRAGGAPSYHEYDGGTHDVGWDALNEPRLLPWLFSQRRVR